MRRLPLLPVVVLITLTGAAPAPAQSGDQCLTADAPTVTTPPRTLRFGLTPQTAGSAGAVQMNGAPVDDAKADAALTALRVPGKSLVVRLNRMFWSDGDAGLVRYAALVDHYARLGLQTELQVRYHPPEGREGDIPGFLDYVRAAVRTFAPRRSVVELSITNEVNLPISPNTSDGAYDGALDAIVQGVVAARAEADRVGRPDLTIGFTYAYRYAPGNDASFFTGIGARADTLPAFRTALDHVGLQLYPGLFWPPATTDAPGDVIEAATLLRDCWMPKAGLGRDVDIWITENGYPTRGGIGEDDQVRDLTGTLDELATFAGTLGVTDYRYFNLRDNNSTGADLFDAVGLLFDDYRPKAAFGAFRDALGRIGTPAAATGPSTVAPVRRPQLRVRVRPSSVRRNVPTVLHVTVVRRRGTAARPVAGALVRVDDRRARTDAHGRATLRVRLDGRPGTRTVRATRQGNRDGVTRLRVHP